MIGKDVFTTLTNILDVWQGSEYFSRICFLGKKPQLYRRGSRFLNQWRPNSEIFLSDLRKLFKRVHSFLQVPRHTFLVGFFLKPKLNKSFLCFCFDIHFKINLVLPQRTKPYVFVPSILQFIWQDLSIAQQTVLVSKTSSRSLQDVFSVTLFVFQDLFKKYLQYVFLKRLQGVFKTSSRRACKTSCNYIFKTSWKTKKCYSEDVLKTSSRCLQYVFTKTNVCWVNAKVSIVEKRMY